MDQFTEHTISTQTTGSTSQSVPSSPTVPTDHTPLITEHECIICFQHTENGIHTNCVVDGQIHHHGPFCDGCYRTITMTAAPRCSYCRGPIPSHPEYVPPLPEFITTHQAEVSLQIASNHLTGTPYTPLGVISISSHSHPHNQQAIRDAAIRARRTLFMANLTATMPTRLFDMEDEDGDEDGVEEQVEDEVENDDNHPMQNVLEEDITNILEEDQKNSNVQNIMQSP